MGLFRDDADIKVRSPHSPAQCLQRLRERTDPFWKIWGLPVGGRFKGDSRVLLKRHVSFSGGFTVILKVKIVENDGGALVLCRAGTNVFIRIFAYAWLSGFLMIGTLFFLKGLYGLIFSDAPLFSDDALFVLIPLGMLAFVAFFHAIEWYGYKRDKNYLMHFVRKAVGGYGLTDSVADECP